MTPTADPDVFIEERLPGYVRYNNVVDGRRWEVHGACTRLGLCMVGAVVDYPGGSIEIESVAHLNKLTRQFGHERLDSELDVPITPGFSGCCEFRYVIL